MVSVCLCWIKRGKNVKDLTAIKGKRLYPLRPVIVRYADVFRAAGLNCTKRLHLFMKNLLPNCLEWPPLLELKKANGSVLLPFAKHEVKFIQWTKWNKSLPVCRNVKIILFFLFGGRGYEEAILEQWEFQYPRVKVVVGKYPWIMSWRLISQLDVLLCMDSANMHFASLVGTRVISISRERHPSLCRFLWLSSRFR